MQPHPPDIEIWAAFKQGDLEAFGELFRRFYPLLFQYGIKICNEPEVIEDCIQELFFELHQTTSATEIQSVKGYLLKAIKYKIYKTFRSNQPAKPSVLIENDMAFEISPENFIIAKQEDQQKKEKILNAFSQLPNRQKEIIYLKIYQQLSYDEISEAMSINYQVARNLFHQAIKSLRKILDV